MSETRKMGLMDRRKGAWTPPALDGLACRRSASWIGATAAWLGLSAATGSDDASGHAIAASASGAALSFGLWPGRRRDDALEAFTQLCETDPDPCALTDEDGGALVANAALRALSQDPPGDAAAALSPYADDAAALVYRLIAAVAAGAACEDGTSAASPGAAEEAARGPRGEAAITCRLIAEGRLLWRVRPAPAAGARASSDAIIETLPVAVARLSPAGEILAANAAARALLGLKARAGGRIGELMEGLGRSMETRIAEAMRGDATGRPEIARGEPGGREVFLQVSLTRIDLDGEPTLAAVLQDATELKTLEAQFVQSQKMQAVGQLAGGVAHDFNNLLTAISGHTDLLLQRHEQGEADYADLNQIRQNANRAAALVRQLLAFSRKQTLRPRVVSLPDVLGEISHLLNRLLGEKVTLRIDHGDDLMRVKVDERQFEQVIMNLVVNARDAMKAAGGEVTLRTANDRIEAETRRGRAVMPKGDYVRIDIVDQGVGIPADKLEQIFEPFYTTKRTGEGTGLGLSTVYGIVKQTGGFIFAESVEGEGATFSIYLPATAAPEVETVPAAPPKPAAEDVTGRGVVMLIEDEAPVRAFASRALKLRGYEVLEAASAEEALDLLADPLLHVDVLVSDVVMPGMDGPSCVREARKMRPDVKVVLVSGYAEDSLKRSMEGLEDCHFLPKPFSLNDLTAKVKDLT
jgi:two-component system cell cycle sensor histidine kinase/response regulator CckA